MIRKNLLLLLVSIFWIFCLWGTLHAAWVIPRTDLRVELLLATGSQDTSGNSRIVTSTGIAPVYETDSTYGVPYAKFNGSGGLKVNTTWSASWSSDFTISYWMKLSGSDLTSNLYYASAPLKYWVWINSRWYYVVISKVYYDKPMVIFSSKTWSADTGDIRFWITQDGKCSFNGDTKIDHLYPDYINWFYRDFYASHNSPFDCSGIKDNRWHHIVLTRKSGIMRMLVDNNPIWSGWYAWWIWKTINLWNFWFSPNSTMYDPYTTWSLNDIIASHYYKGWIAWFREYSVALSDTDIDSLYEEFKYAQSDLAWAWWIVVTMGGYSSPNLSINLKNIPLNLSKDSTQYQYSLDWINFFPILDLIDTSTSTGSYSYRANMNLTGVNDGRVNITLRVVSGQSFQNIGTVWFNKIDITPSITITAPNSDIATSKTITATVSTGWILYLSLTRWASCDASLALEDYSDLTFTTLTDNGIRVCYKAFYPSTNKTIYKLSPTIQGIQPTDNIISSPTVKLFDNFTLWQKSLYAKPLDTASFILDLLSVSASASQGTINGITMTDINGDGLVDFLYSRNDPVRRAIVINNGNYTFKTVYRCAVDSSPIRDIQWTITGYTYIYYGDCADTTR